MGEIDHQGVGSNKPLQMVVGYPGMQTGKGNAGTLREPWLDKVSTQQSEAESPAAGANYRRAWSPAISKAEDRSSFFKKIFFISSILFDTF